MDLEYSDRHKALQEEVRQFIAVHGDKAPLLGGGRKPPDAKTLEWQKRLVGEGYFARTIPTEYGGFGAPPDVVETAIIADEFNNAGVHPGLKNQGISMLVPTLLEVGTEEQRARWIETTILGETIWCQGYSEPGAGSDLTSLRTKAELDGDEFVINGQKIWTSSAHYADMMFLLARTEPDVPKHRGISYLLVPMDTPGIEVRPLRTMTERSEFNEVFFTDARIPADQIVMGRGDGWNVANVTLKHERGLLGDPNKMLHRLTGVERLMTETEIDGVRILDMPEYRDRLMRLRGEALASKYHGMRLLSDQARDEDPGIRRMIVKLGGTILAYKITSLAIDVLGEAGLPYDPHGEDAEDDPATNWQVDYMYDVGLIIGGGSSNIQRNIIAERGLGLPRELKPPAPDTGG